MGQSFIQLALATIPPAGSPTAGEGIDFGGVREWLPVLLLLIGLMLLMGSAVRRKASRSSAQPAAPDERIRQIRQAAAGRESLDAVKADAEELAQRLAAHLDNKAARLETLIAEADRRIDALQQAASAVGHPARSRASAAELRPDDAPRQLETAPARRAGSDTRQDRDDAFGERRAHEPVRDEIYRLADEGLPPIEIARQLDQPTGQIELVLALRRV